MKNWVAFLLIAIGTGCTISAKVQSKPPVDDWQSRSLNKKIVAALNKLSLKFAAKGAKAIASERKKQEKMEKYWRGEIR